MVRLTDNPASDTAPCWSPDGSRIIFISSRDGKDPEINYPYAYPGNNNNIYVMNADGLDEIRLTDDPYYHTRAIWSPDGAQIVFDSLMFDIKYAVFKMNADGSDLVRLTDNNASNDSPACSS